MLSCAPFEVSWHGDVHTYDVGGREADCGFLERWGRKKDTEETEGSVDAPYDERWPDEVSEAEDKLAYISEIKDLWPYLVPESLACTQPPTRNILRIPGVRRVK